MVRAFAVGAIAGVGYMLAESFAPSTKSGVIDKAINLTAAGLAGLAAMHFLHKK